MRKLFNSQSLAATATAQTPITILLKEGESVDLFNQELSITLDGYSSLISSDITFTVRGLESARQTFEDVSLGETVFYPGKNKFVIVVNDIHEEEDILIAELIVFMR